MKKKIIATILLILMYMLFVSCTTGSAQVNNDKVLSSQNTNFQQIDTLKEKSVFKKKIQPMQINSDRKLVKKDSTYTKLERIEKILKKQQRQIDSIIVFRKK